MSMLDNVLAVSVIAVPVGLGIFIYKEGIQRIMSMFVVGTASAISGTIQGAGQVVSNGVNSAYSSVSTGPTGTVLKAVGLSKKSSGSVIDKVQRGLTIVSTVNPLFAPIVAADDIGTAIFSSKRRSELKACGREHGGKKLSCGIKTFLGF